MRLLKQKNLKTVALNEFANRLAEGQISLITPEEGDADQEEDTDNTQTESGYYNQRLVSRVVSDYFRESYEDYIRRVRQADREYYTERRLEEIDEDYYPNDVVEGHNQREQEWYSYAGDVEEVFEAYKNPWHRNAPVGLYVEVDAGVMLKSLFTQEHSTSLGNRWSTDFETQVGLGGGVRVGYAWAMPDNLPVRFRLEGGYIRGQTAGNKNHFSENYESFSDLNRNGYEANFIVDLPKLFDNADKRWRSLSVHFGGGVINVDPNLTYTVSLENSGNPPNTFHLEGDNSPGLQFIAGVSHRMFTDRVRVGISASWSKFWENATSSGHGWSDRQGQMQKYDALIGSMERKKITVTASFFVPRPRWPWDY